MAAKAIDGSELQAQISTKQSAHQASGGGGGDVESARCHCCGLTEECTPAYIARVRERHEGNWICGLCAEAVKYEAVRSRSRSDAGGGGGAGIGVDEAMRRHAEFCEQFRSSSPPISPADDLISAMKQILRRSIDSPRKGGAAAGAFAANCRPLGRSKSCFATIPEAPSHE